VKKYTVVGNIKQSVAERKEKWSQKLDFYLQNGHLRDNNWQVIHFQLSAALARR